MTMTMQRAWNSLRRRMIYNLHPRAIRWKYLRRSAPGQAVFARLGKDMKVRVYPHDIIGEGIYVEGCSEVSTWRLIEEFLRPGMVFFDLGANLGQYTLLGAKCVGCTGQVHSFEPSERMYSELTFNVEFNSFQGRCTLNRAAVSDKRGVARLSKYAPGGEVYGSLGTQHWAQNAEIVGHEEVQTIRLDDYMKEHEVARIDLMKMDIEGAELLALRGGREVLSRADGPVIVLEVADVNTQGFGYRALEIVHELNQLGYFVHHLQEDGKIGPLVDNRVECFHGENLVAEKKTV